MASGDRRNADPIILATLAGGGTVAEAATRANVGERTVWRRLQEPAFRDALDEARRQTVAAAIDRLSQAAGAAATTLAQLLGDDYPAAIRLRAAVAVLEVGARLREAGELEARVEALEQALAERDQIGRRPRAWGG